MKKRRKYMKLNLLETSAVGIPAYPDAHFSLSKAISDYIGERGDNSITMSETEQLQAATKSEGEMLISTLKDASPEAAKAVEAQVVKAEETVKVEANISDLIAKAVAEAIDKLSVQRGLVETEKTSSVKEQLSSMTLGELAVKAGYFK